MLGKYMGKLLGIRESVRDRVHPGDELGPRVGQHEKRRRPKWLKLPSIHNFNFILLHYIYIVGMTLLFSLVIWAERNLSYTNALFFTAGGVTQSGLNPIDVNLLSTYQQVVLLLMACLCNPIVINSFVVFVRLYWFEKRFQGVVRSANDFRRARTQSRMKSEEKKDLEVGALPGGVGGREIRILHNRRQSQQDNAAIKFAASQEKETRRTSAGSTSDSNGEDVTRIEKAQQPDTTPPRPFHRDIVFADELPKRTTTDDVVVPTQRTPEQHIAFLENQRRPRDTGVLRIPGPRDLDEGVEPQRIERDEGGNEIGRPNSHDSAERPATRRGSGFNMDDHPVKEEYSEKERRGSVRKFVNFLSWGGGSRSSTTNEAPLTFRERAFSTGRSIGQFLTQERSDGDPNPYLSYAPTIGRNSTFVNLTEEQREELGGIEYRSLKTLAWILIGYFFGWSILSIIIFLPWIINSHTYNQIVKADGQGVPWWGVFTPMSHFTDLGFTLTPDSMVSFQTAVMPMLVGSFFIVIGNTGFPCMLRFIIWTISKLVPKRSGVWEELRFLLDHPRRCFTLLFPRHATWWLFGVLVLLNSIDVILFIILDLHDPTVSSLPGGIQFLDGLYQAASTRTAGFACVNLAALHPGIQVSYLIMMYISVFPIAISVRRTNVYEEKSLGVYNMDPEEEDDIDVSTSKTKYLSAHLRRQLSFDLWFVFLGLFLICIIEGDRIANTNEYAFTIFSVLFEIVSAYGTVGLSLGYPNTNASFSAQFKNLSKLIIIAMMTRGRHRGLPYALDRAVLLPSESLQKKEIADDVRRADRRASMASSMHRGSFAVGNSSGVYLHGVPMGARTTSAAVTEAGDDEVVDNTPRHKRSRSRGAANIANILSGALTAGPVGKKHA